MLLSVKCMLGLFVFPAPNSDMDYRIFNVRKWSYGRLALAMAPPASVLGQSVLVQRNWFVGVGVRGPQSP